MVEQTELEKLKSKHGEIITLSVLKDSIYLKKPTRQIISLSMTNGMSDPLAQSEVIVENCFVGGTLTKETILEDSGLLVGINAKIGEIIGFKAVEVKNL